jgi:hypothetical protein
MNDKVRRFAEEMEIQLKNNSRKGTIFDFKDFEGIITELEYHKAKMMIAIRMGNLKASKEYIADSANFLLALGNLLELYEQDSENIPECYELNKDVEIFIKKNVDEQSNNQKIF